MTNTSKTTASQTVATPVASSQIVAAPASTKDSGRVHVGGGMMRF